MGKQNTDLNNETGISPPVNREYFIHLCNRSYILLYNGGLEAEIDKIGEEKILIAIRRILGVFQDLEEYDKCIFLRDLIDNKFKCKIEPLFDYKV